MAALRDYQVTAVDAVFDYYKSKSGNPLVVMPTGTGKSWVQASLTKRVFDNYPKARTLLLCHKKELLVQDEEKLRALWPDAPCGFYSAGLKKKQPFMPIVFGGVKSVVNNIEKIGFRDIVFVDEAHAIPPEGKGEYLRVIRKLTEINSDLKVVGLTATHFRMGQGLLTDGGEVFTDIAIDMTTPEWFQWFIANNYLVQPVPQITRTLIDTSGVDVLATGEFNMTQLQHASDRYEITFAAAQEAIYYGQMRRSWITFCSGIEHAIHAADIFNKLGIPTGVVHSNMDDGERDRTIDDWKTGRIRNICNNDILTVGIDNPMCDMLIGLRASQSPGLWVQMVGRILRPFEGKINGLVLDFARNTKVLGTIDHPRIPKKKGEGNGEIPVKLCDGCGAYNHISARFCCQCFEPFSIQVKIKEEADTSELLSSGGPDVAFFDVDNVVYNRNINHKTGNETVKATYHCGPERWSEVLSFNDKDGYPGKCARDWWRRRAGDDYPVPPNVKMALGSIAYVKKPKRIRVWKNKTPFPEILSVEF